MSTWNGSTLSSVRDGQRSNAVLSQVAFELGEDVVGPLRLVQPAFGEAEQGIPKVCGIEHARVEDDGERHECRSAGVLGGSHLFVHPAFVGDLHHTVESVSGLHGVAFAIGEDS